MKELFKEKISELINKFEKEKYHYLSNKYLESEVRQDFLDPLFESLGWDIGNKKSLSPFEREVVVEKGETKGRPDYNFRIDGFTKFYVEAKAPHEPLDKVEHILQAKSYAWNTKDVFIVLLTDFEEFKLFDASLAPDPNHPNRGIILDLKYDKFLDNIDNLWLLSKEEVENGSLDNLLLKDSQSKKYRVPVDVAFLNQIEEWRLQLATSAYKQQPNITVKKINSVVQRFLDRIIFIRIAEDRKIIEPRTLQDIVDVWFAEGKRRPIQYHLNILFKRINQDLNGEIFKPHDCENTEFDSEIIARVIENLYFPKSPYRFEIMGVELLGSIYERFLGNTIRTTPKQVKIEPKPDVKKAGGVYYTPKYIVNYIVKNTVGNKINGLSPDEISNIKIIDPSCGSGSFLIGAFQYLIDYHVNWYIANPSQIKQGELFPDIIEIDGEKKLSVTKKSSILSNNIYGVDIDPQAVEVTMMSLYLKILEGEKSLPSKKGLLPSLSSNIKCGNSLIGYDYLLKQLEFNIKIENEEIEKENVNPFDWSSTSQGFGKTISNGGFDCVIGNPPWGALFSENENIYVKKQFRNIIVRMTDSFMYFIIKSLEILNNKGYFGMILPDVVLYQNDNKLLRQYILNNTSIKQVLNLGNEVFENVTRPSCIVITNNKKIKTNSIVTLDISSSKKNEKQKLLQNEVFSNIKQALYETIPNSLFVTNNIDDYKILNNILNRKNIQPLEQFVDSGGIQRGVSPDYKDAFVIKQNIIDEHKLEKSIIVPVLTGGREVKRFKINSNEQYLIYTDRNTKYSDYPNICSYIDSFKNKITCKEVKQKKHSIYSLHRARDKQIFLKENKILGVITEDEIVVAKDENIYFATDGLYLFQLENINLTPYIMGILNSNLFIFIYRLLTLESGRVLAQVKPTLLAKLPIISFNNSELQNSIIEYVNKIENSNDSDFIEILKENINDMVYKLYNITDNEISIINLRINNT